MKTVTALFSLLLLLSGCNFSKSVKVDLTNNLVTKGNQLSCEDVSVLLNGEKTGKTTFTYGQSISVYLDDLKGLVTESGKIFPAMDMFVTGKTGDTVLATRDLYSQYTDGISLSPVQLNARLVLASPIHSGSDYTVFVKLRDKKGNGSYDVKFPFSVKADDRLKIDAGKATYSELYMFSKTTGEAITDGKVKPGETFYLVIEGLKGFPVVNGKVFAGLSLKAISADGKTIVERNDLFEEINAQGINAEDFGARLSASLKFNDNPIKNPVNCEFVLFDKNTDQKLSVTTMVTVE
jgi:hypothetical protein